MLAHLGEASYLYLPSFAFRTLVLRTSTFAPAIPNCLSVSLWFSFLVHYLNAKGLMANPATLPLILFVAAM